MADETASHPDDLHRRIDALSPDRRRLLSRRLAELGKAGRQPLPCCPERPGSTGFPPPPTSSASTSTSRCGRNRRRTSCR